MADAWSLRCLQLPNKRTAAEEAAWLTRKLQLCAVATTGIFDRRVFVALATGYRLSGASSPELCMHNAEVRRTCRRGA